MANANAVKEAMNVWGRKYLSEYGGYVVADDAEIDFTDHIRSDGYCDSCYSEWTVVTVSSGDIEIDYTGSMIDLLEAMTAEIND